MNVKVNEVYAFVANGLGGNKAGVVLDAENLSDKQLQFIAHAVGASETAFILPDNQATYRLRFFTPTVEVHLYVAMQLLPHGLSCLRKDYTKLEHTLKIHKLA